MDVVIFSITTDASGDYVGEKVVKTPSRLIAAQWVDGDLVDGVRFILDHTDFTPRDTARRLMDVDDANADALYYPKVTGDTAAGVEITDAYESPLVHGTLTLTVEDGGDTKSGSLVLYLQA